MEKENLDTLKKPQQNPKSELKWEWGGSAGVVIFDGRSINVADLLNRIKNGMD